MRRAEQEQIANLQQLMRIPSLSGMEEPIQQYICGEFGKAGIQNFRQGENVVAHLRGQDSQRLLIFNSHVDVVKPQDLSRWKFDPWSGEIKDGRIYGRGASDMKMGVAASMEVAHTLAERAKQGKLPYDVMLTYVTKEELDGSGTESFVEWFKNEGYMDKYSTIAAVFTEPSDTDEMVLDKIKCAVEQKVKRVKIKIKPGRDVELIKKIRSNFPTLALQVDGNAAYKLESENHIKLLKSLDQYNLLMIEQPGPNDDRFYHAKLSHLITTPICLDESILHLRHVKEAIALWKNDSSTKRLIINIKPARVGGFWEAIQIAHLCKKEKIKTWCGGMLETALGKLANLHFNAATELSLPGDHVSQKPYYINDVMKPIAAVEGILTVPDEVGWGYNKATEQFFTA